MSPNEKYDSTMDQKKGNKLQNMKLNTRQDKKILPTRQDNPKEMRYQPPATNMRA